MSDLDKDFIGSIPDIYDEYLVPLIFESYARDMAKRVAETNPKSILETAAGSGVVARALAPLLNDDTRYIVTDLNQPMLDRAARIQPKPHNIEWRAADALALPFEDASFDTICCQFGVMFFPDMKAGYREAARVLRDDGRFIFNVWDKIEENHFAQSVTATAARFFPDDPPVFMARTPHGHFDTTKITVELRDAGFNHIACHTITEESRANSPRDPAIAYCQGTPLRNELEARDASMVEQIVDAAARDIEQSHGPGPVVAKIQGHVFVASR